MDPDATAIRAVQIANEQLVKGARVEGTGVGAGVAPRICDYQRNGASKAFSALACRARLTSLPEAELPIP